MAVYISPKNKVLDAGNDLSIAFIPSRMATVPRVGNHNFGSILFCPSLFTTTINYENPGDKT